MKKKTRKKTLPKTSKKTLPKTPRPNRKLPFISIATICEKVLTEENNVMSLIRLVDRFTISGPTDSMPTGILDFVIFLYFRSGDAVGRRRITLRTTEPDGTVKILQKLDAEFVTGGSAAMNIRTKFRVKLPGQYWIDVEIGKQLLTRIPLLVEYVKSE